jgi:hypothetical protein
MNLEPKLLVGLKIYILGFSKIRVFFQASFNFVLFKIYLI